MGVLVLRLMYVDSHSVPLGVVMEIRKSITEMSDEELEYTVSKRWESYQRAATELQRRYIMQGLIKTEDLLAYHRFWHREVE